jgi:hypothetical protein
MKMYASKISVLLIHWQIEIPLGILRTLNFSILISSGLNWLKLIRMQTEL